MTNVVQQLEKRQPDIQSLDLSNQQIDILTDEIVQHLLRFQNLDDLNLSDNQFKNLPCSFKQLKLKQLNLRGTGLQTLEACIILNDIKSLEELNIDLKEGEQEYIETFLPQLFMLNGTQMKIDVQEVPELSLPTEDSIFNMNSSEVSEFYKEQLKTQE